MQIVENWVRQELLYQEALTRKLDQQARLKMLLEQTRRDLLVAALLDDEFSSEKLDFSEDDILRYYDVHQDQFQRAIPEVKARHILLSSQREANARRCYEARNLPMWPTSIRSTSTPATRAVT